MTMANQVPEIRTRIMNDAALRTDGDYVLYWMVAQRRLSWNFALDRALDWARELAKPLLILEALRVGYRWASDRLHRFVLQGMAFHREATRRLPVRYYPYVEPESGHGAGLIERLASRAAVVVTDDFPCFFLPTMLKLAARRLTVRLEAVDSNGMLPLRAADKAFPSAYAFRRFLQRVLPEHLEVVPRENPFLNVKVPPPVDLPREVLERWPEADTTSLTGTPAALARLPIDHQVSPAVFDGGTAAARQTFETFLVSRFERYADERNEPDDSAASGLSPYLHFGHISTHEIFTRVAERENWTRDHLSSKVNGSRAGWWNMSRHAESFLDELITWRELGYNMCWQREDYDRYESLPSWARETLAAHQLDERRWVYSLRQLAEAATHDELWNAAQRQLVREGRMHNYLRMLWGKKVIEWSETPEQALEFLIELNNRYAVDGRNPNSYSGIFWCFGRYDRPWGPERPIFGKVRYMSSDNTRRKLKLTAYLERYGPQTREQPRLFH